MLTYHRTCAQMSIFIVNTVGMFIKIWDMMYILGRDFLNILWGIGLLMSYVYNQKLFVFGFVYGYILKKILEFYVHWVFHGPVILVGYYLCMRLVKVYQQSVWLEGSDPLQTAEEEEKARIIRALAHLGLVQHGVMLDNEKIEFYEEWNAYVKKVENYDPFENTESEADDEEESESEEELVECDECGERDIDPNDLDHNEKNLGDIGGGYAHEACMSAERLKEYEEMLEEEVENEVEDEEVKKINSENIEDEKNIPITRGWLNFATATEKSKVG